ncbi:helix-turn-helix domain-containing protein [Streptomonospora wellingtoniae]|uniref:Pyridoxamine 5'-phosphate oxidase family protein n=1 Tax=Streptomonospora wellingtoniae TaxID=3075544 RepID=A0ABU2L078_9ACTN|nr:pyridoxamine 5'-phosphate oxidase family protein [Streptomonospora sp. DSM 45055]MDT0304917.1 pyridoxamine 5'-phosphate oxidase family protein [Streptomonospora sp. DSM 45055]
MKEPHQGDGGDLGRRVAQRRAELGLSHDQVAESASMDPGYVAYLEEHPGSLSRQSLYRLAQALRTSPAQLLGADTETPPGHAATAEPDPGIRPLSTEECLKLIAPGGVGRAAFTEAAGTSPAVLPVNYTLSEGAVVFRTAADGVIARHTPGPMSFQVDRIDGGTSEGWSVLATGRAAIVNDARLAALREHHTVRPWAGGERDVWIRIDAERITGRRVGGRRALGEDRT